jgi:DNA-binding transcriptional MerR regulator
MENKEKAYSAPKNVLAASAAVDFFMADYLMNENLAHVRDDVRTKNMALDSENLSYRIINHWQNEGLISDLRPAGKGWRKYSLIDRVWIEVIVELRKFGYPLERIKQVKARLEEAETETSSSMPFLETHFVLAYFFKEPCYLMVFPEGEVLLAIQREYDLSEEIGLIDSHIKINLNRLIQRMFPNKDMKPKRKNSVELSPEEMELMLFVRTGNFETITVKRKDGKIDLIEATESLSVADARLTEIIKEQDYQNIEIKTAEGKTVCIKRTIKKKV